ncbi:MAG: apolipoprotein N-acyltransferase, partial [bacterium]
TGVLTALSFDPFCISVLGFVAYVPLFFVLSRVEKSLWKTLAYAWLSMFITIIISFQWIHFVAVEFGLLSKFQALLVLIAFSVFTNLSLQIFSILYHFAARLSGWTKGRFFYFVIIPSLFVISEFLDPRIFNWYIGNLLSSFTYLPQFADFFGVYGLSFFVILINVCAFLLINELVKNRKFHYKKILPEFLLVISVFLFLSVYGYYNYKHVQKIEDSCPKIKTAVIQANIGNPMQLEINQAAKLRKEMNQPKEMSDQALILNKYNSMSRRAVEENPGVELIVWPETAFPGFYVDRNPQMAEHRKLVEELGIPFLIGGYFVEYETGRYYNSAILVTKNELDFYHKKILLPFGEYMPLSEYLPSLKSIVPSVGDFSRGSGARTLDLIIDGLEVRFAPTICYEVLNQHYVREMYNKDAHIFLNLSNDSWFGKVEPYQHLRLSKIRSIEFRRPILRSTNTGITTMIDMNGSAVGSSKLDKEEILVFDVPVCDHRIRTIYATAGYLFPYALILLTGFLAIIRIRRKKNNANRS